jgi:DNA polymerase-3 subunit alpha
MPDKTFVNLHAHSFYSLGDAICSTDEMARKAKELGMTALAITDHGTLSGWLQFRDSCKKYGIKSIFGFEAYFVDDVHEVHAVNDKIHILQDEIKVLNKVKTKKGKLIVAKENGKLLELQEQRNVLKKYNHLILLAKNFEGAQNLIKIHNEAVLDGVYYKPRISWATLERYRGGIVATTACLGGRINKLLEKDNIQGAKEAVARYKAIFGPENFFLELQLHDIQLQTETNGKLIKLAEATDTPLTLACDSHYSEEGEHTTRQLIRNLDKEPDEINNDDALTDLYIKNEDMLLKSWRKYMPGHKLDILAKAILNTRKIADMVEVFPFDTALKFPTFDTGDLNQEDFLSKQAWTGLANKGLAGKPEYVERLKFELNTVNLLGFASYFNVVGDLVNEAKKNQPVGIGRGSAGGSLLSYVIGITSVDPLKFELFFERFLSKEKGVLAPSFGIELAGITYNTEEILEHADCDCHKNET